MPIGKKKIKTFRDTEIAEVLGISRHTVKKMRERGDLEGNTLADVVKYVRGTATSSLRKDIKQRIDRILLDV